jgi:hypothetical protein
VSGYYNECDGYEPSMIRGMQKSKQTNNMGTRIFARRGFERNERAVSDELR